MSRIYLIAGLGADTRVYNNIDLHEHEVTPVDWIEPNVSDTLSIYAQKLIYQYNILPNSLIIGNSLGGMIAVEIAKLIPDILACSEHCLFISLSPGNGLARWVF
jgi:homoserine acetyltransferase